MFCCLFGRLCQTNLNTLNSSSHVKNISWKSLEIREICSQRRILMSSRVFFRGRCWPPACWCCWWPHGTRGYHLTRSTGSLARWQEHSRIDLCSGITFALGSRNRCHGLSWIVHHTAIIPRQRVNKLPSVRSDRPVLYHTPTVSCGTRKGCLGRCRIGWTFAGVFWENHSAYGLERTPFPIRGFTTLLRTSGVEVHSTTLAHDANDHVM